jgi:hypothetical protein
LAESWRGPKGIFSPLYDYHFWNAVFGKHCEICLRQPTSPLAIHKVTMDYSQLPTLEFCKRRIRAGIPKKLTNLLAVHSLQLATNPKAFVLLDLSADLRTSDFQPDCSQDVDEVYKRTAILCLGLQSPYDVPSLAFTG